MKVIFLADCIVFDHASSLHDESNVQHRCLAALFRAYGKQIAHKKNPEFLKQEIRFCVVLYANQKLRKLITRVGSEIGGVRVLSWTCVACDEEYSHLLRQLYVKAKDCKERIRRWIALDLLCCRRIDSNRPTLLQEMKQTQRKEINRFVKKTKLYDSQLNGAKSRQLHCLKFWIRL